MHGTLRHARIIRLIDSSNPALVARAACLHMYLCTASGTVAQEVIQSLTVYLEKNQSLKADWLSSHLTDCHTIALYVRSGMGTGPFIESESLTVMKADWFTIALSSMLAKNRSCCQAFLGACRLLAVVGVIVKPTLGWDRIAHPYSERALPKGC